MLGILLRREKDAITGLKEECFKILDVDQTFLNKYRIFPVILRKRTGTWRCRAFAELCQKLDQERATTYSWERTTILRVPGRVKVSFHRRKGSYASFAYEEHYMTFSGDTPRGQVVRDLNRTMDECFLRCKGWTKAWSCKHEPEDLANFHAYIATEQSSDIENEGEDPSSILDGIYRARDNRRCLKDVSLSHAMFFAK